MVPGRWRHDEGGFAPDLGSNREALDLLVEAVERTGLEPGADMAVALDAASSELWSDGGYALASERAGPWRLSRWRGSWRACATPIPSSRPIVSVEDALAEDDWEGWAAITAALGERVQLVGADHLTSLYIPELAEPAAAELARFDELVRVLREKCPWDREQTHASLRRHLLSEAHELLEALDARAAHPDSEPVAAVDDLLEEELGDLLFQVGFHSRLVAERGAFTLADVARRIHGKLVARHPLELPP